MRWRDTADVYGADPGTGAYTVLLKEDLGCHLALLGAGGDKAGDERAELAGERRLLWDPAYVMAEGVQVEIDGQRWNTQRGTFAAPSNLDGAVRYRRCEVVRAS